MKKVTRAGVFIGEGSQGIWKEVLLTVKHCGWNPRGHVGLECRGYNLAASTTYRDKPQKLLQYVFVCNLSCQLFSFTNNDKDRKKDILLL